MGKSSKILKGLAVAGLFCLGSIQAVKADALPAGPTYSALITYAGTNPTSQIWNNAAAVTESVTFTNIGGVVGIQIGTYPTTPTSGPIIFSPPNCTASTCLPTSSPFFAYVPVTGLTISGTNAAPTIANPASGTNNAVGDQLCVLNNLDNFNSCNTNVTGSTTTVAFSYLNGVFTLADASITFKFSLNSVPVTTPEPSSLLGLGTGLLGLFGFFGLRRKGIA